MIERLVVLAVMVGLIAAAALLLRRRDGRVRSVEDGVPFDEHGLGVRSGRGALVVITAPGCGACATAWNVLQRVASARDGVDALAVDLAARPRLVSQLGILRLPTTLVVDTAGTVRHRVSGVPTQAVLADLLDGLPQTGGRVRRPPARQ